MSRRLAVKVAMAIVGGGLIAELKREAEVLKKQQIDARINAIDAYAKYEAGEPVGIEEAQIIEKINKLHGVKNPRAVKLLEENHLNDQVDRR